MRQLMHGAVPFDSKKLDDLPRLLQLVRFAVTRELKSSLNVPETDPPIAHASGLSLSGFLGLSSTREIVSADLPAI